MSYLSAGGWADVATKAGLAVLRTELHATITNQTRTLFLGSEVAEAWAGASGAATPTDWRAALRARPGVWSPMVPLVRRREEVTCLGRRVAVSR